MSSENSTASMETHFDINRTSRETRSLGSIQDAPGGAGVRSVVMAAGNVLARDDGSVPVSCALRLAGRRMSCYADLRRRGE